MSKLEQEVLIFQLPLTQVFGVLLTREVVNLTA